MLSACTGDKETGSGRPRAWPQFLEPTAGQALHIPSGAALPALARGDLDTGRRDLGCKEMECSEEQPHVECPSAWPLPKVLVGPPYPQLHGHGLGSRRPALAATPDLPWFPMPGSQGG